MTNTVVAVILSVWSVMLAVLGERKSTASFARRGNIYTSVAGAVIFLLSAAVSVVAVVRMDENEKMWAGEVMTLCGGVMLALFSLLFAVCAVTSLISQKNERLRGGLMHKLRVVMIATSAIFILLSSYLSYIAASDHASLDLYLVAGGAGLSCMMRACALIENKTEKNNEK